MLLGYFSRHASKCLRLGPMAQWKSVPFTPERSLVRSQLGPRTSPQFEASPEAFSWGDVLCVGYILRDLEALIS